MGYRFLNGRVIGKHPDISKIRIADEIAHRYGLNPLEVLEGNNGRLYEFYLAAKIIDSSRRKKYTDEVALQGEIDGITTVGR